MQSACHSQFGRRFQLTVAAAAVLIWTSVVQAQPIRDARDPYVAASQSTGVPLELLAAIAGAESAYHPWALNMRGRQVYCRSRAEAERLLNGFDDVDIGLMQINFPRWGRRLGLSKSQLLDPQTNLLAGARILRECLNRSGDLWQRIGSYHSSRPDKRRRYNQEVYKSYLRYVRGEVR